MTFHISGIGDIVVVWIFHILIDSQQPGQTLLILHAGESLHVHYGSMAALHTLLPTNCYSSNTLQLRVVLFAITSGSTISGCWFSEILFNWTKEKILIETVI